MPVSQPCGHRRSHDRTARVYAPDDTGTPAVRHTLRHPDYVNAVHMSAGVLATGCYDRVVRTYALVSGELTRELRGHGCAIFGVAICGSMLASGAYDGTVRVWSLREGDATDKCSAVLEHGGDVRGVALWPSPSAGGLLLASLSSGSSIFHSGRLTVWKRPAGHSTG